MCGVGFSDLGDQGNQAHQSSDHKKARSFERAPVFKL
jgi:hypothetical protein